MTLSRLELERHVVHALNLGSQSFTVLSAPGIKPLRVASRRVGDARYFNIYAWNVTHGGVSRSLDEFRIQITGATPAAVPGEQTLIIGWSGQFEVFAAWDPSVHLNRNASSPSLQIPRGTLESAYDRGLAAETRGSGDVVVAFRPDLLSAYAHVAGSMHADDAITLAAELNEIPSASFYPPVTRTKTARIVEAYFREWDFGARVLNAYDHSCAICGLQLGLVEAAHIVPVAVAGSTDETRNGLCLCRIHHRAYDALLVDVAPDLTIKVSASQIARLRALGRAEGSGAISELDGRRLLVVPDAVSDRPYAAYLLNGSRSRNWVP